MPFFPEIDEKKTIKQADKKLREYPRWRRVANDVGRQKVTQMYTFEREKMLEAQKAEGVATKKDEAARELYEIRQAISGLFDPTQRKILFDRYLATDNVNDYIIYNELNISHSTYYDILNNALLAFAEIYRCGELLVEK